MGDQQQQGLHLPSVNTLQTLKLVLELGLLLIAYPWILYRLFTDPRGLMRNREGS